MNQSPGRRWPASSTGGSSNDEESAGRNPGDAPGGDGRLPAGADDRDVYTFEGRGWGHGVGLSQYGARGMAMEGYGYKEIVTHYYKGTSVGTIADSVGSDSFLRTTDPTGLGGFAPAIAHQHHLLAHTWSTTATR